MNLTLPKLSLVLLIGPSGSGKSTFARKHFLPTEVVSSDRCRGLISDNENAQEVTEDAFELLRFVVRTRLRLGRLTVVDATNVQQSARQSLIALGREYHVPCVAVVFDVPESVCQARNRERPDRQFGPHVIRNQLRDLHRSLGGLRREGFLDVYKLGPREVEDIEFERTPLWPDRSDLTGPFDIIGDVHGCADELVELLTGLGYRLEERANPRFVEGVPLPGRSRGKNEPVPIYYDVVPPDGRRAIFVGDLVDRGPDSPRVLKIATSMVRSGMALAVPGNHDDKLLRHLLGRKVQVAHGLQETIDQLAEESPEFREDVVRFLDSLVSHVVLDGSRLVVAHAGLKESMHGRASSRVRDFALFGDTTGETDEFGLPVRYPWAEEYRGRATVVYGHTPVAEPEWVNGTINIDTGCVFGGRLTALRYPERDLVSVPCRRVYALPVRPFLKSESLPSPSAQHAVDDVLDLADVSGKRLIETRLGRMVTIREENATAALESISRFAANPKWLIYLPPTMSPSETSLVDGYLERPEQALAYFAGNGVSTVVCEEKHMGSRAVVVVCRDERTAGKRFGVTGEGIGTVLTRTGRRFFEESATEQAVLNRIVGAADRAGLWDELGTDWMVLDAEMMPWSAKAQELIRRQYALVGTAAIHATAAAMASLRSCGLDDPAVLALRERTHEREALAGRFVEAYRRYCWPVHSLDDYRLAPFHLLASEGAVHIDKPHPWHMSTLGRICGDGLLVATEHRVIDLSKGEDVMAVSWWEELTARGGEGMVVKPLDFVTMGPKGLVQPALKCRGREYLRIIYGPEYTLPANLERLRKRGLRLKRSLALREFALGVEALERFVGGEPLRRVHECVFGVLALESEPVDPRL